jgi:uncharacterized protein
MTVAGALSLDADALALVRRLIDRVLPGARVAVFGSRATGRARPFSDLDLLVMEPRHLTWTQRADLRDAFEASDLPFKVDVVELDSLPEGMARRAQEQARPLP